MYSINLFEAELKYAFFSILFDLVTTLQTFVQDTQGMVYWKKKKKFDFFSNLMVDMEKKICIWCIYVPDTVIYHTPTVICFFKTPRIVAFLWRLPCGFTILWCLSKQTKYVLCLTDKWPKVKHIKRNQIYSSQCENKARVPLSCTKVI